MGHQQNPKVDPIQFFSLELVPWKWHGVIIRGGEPDSVRKWVRKKYGFDIDPGSAAAGYSYVQYNSFWVLWIQDVNNLPHLLHECIHIVNGVMEGRGLVLCDQSEEAYTYTTEHLFREITSSKKWKNAK